MKDKIATKGITVKPWGSEILIEHNDHYIIKILCVKSGHRLSLQYHEKKHETMYILNGNAEVELGDEKTSCSQGQFIVISPMTKHRVKAISGLTILEMSSPLDDNDIVRLEDDYGRVKDCD